MITIYAGSKPLMPLLACQVHLQDEPSVIQTVDQLLTSAWDWKNDPLKIIGSDCKNSQVCCVVYGRHGAMYQRAIAGMADIFELNIRWIDTDMFINKQASYHLWMAACLSAIHWQGRFWQSSREMLLKLVRLQMTGSR